MEPRRGRCRGPFSIDVTNIQEFPVNFANINGTLFFSGSDGQSGNELWKTDGTAAGTQLVKDIIPGVGGSGKSDFMNVNGTLYFVTADNVDWGLWKSDGTAAGTVLVKEGTGGENSFFPSMLTNVNGTLYFTASDADHGMQIWTSDGTASGTVRLSDAFAKQLHVNEFRLSNTNGTLLFTANDGTHGSELWKLGSDISPPPTVNQPPSGTDKTITLATRRQLYAVDRRLWFFRCQSDAAESFAGGEDCHAAAERLGGGRWRRGCRGPGGFGRRYCRRQAGVYVGGRDYRQYARQLHVPGARRRRHGERRNRSRSHRPTH